MKTDRLKRDLAGYARRMAQDGLVIGTSGNLSARYGRRFYIKASGKSFEKLNIRDFTYLDIDNPSIRGLRIKPSREYRLHAACYSKRPDIKAVFHTHPFFVSMAFSKNTSGKPVTMEFAAYIGKSITCVEFMPPGSSRLAGALGAASCRYDCIIMKKHGIITLGRTMQEAYVKNLIVEREAKARIIRRLLQIKGSCFSRKEMALLISAV
jgi:L-fuculose-phosphate aldolase